MTAIFKMSYENLYTLLCLYTLRGFFSFKIFFCYISTCLGDVGYTIKVRKNPHLKYIGSRLKRVSQFRLKMELHMV